MRHGWGGDRFRDQCALELGSVRVGGAGSGMADLGGLYQLAVVERCRFSDRLWGLSC